MKKKIIIISSMVIAVIIFVIIAFNTFLLPKNNFNVIMNHIKIGDIYNKIQRYLDESKLKVRKKEFEPDSLLYSEYRVSQCLYYGEFIYNKNSYDGYLSISLNSNNEITIFGFQSFSDLDDEYTMNYLQRKYGEPTKVIEDFEYRWYNKNTEIVYINKRGIWFVIYDEEMDDSIN